MGPPVLAKIVIVRDLVERPGTGSSVRCRSRRRQAMPVVDRATPSGRGGGAVLLDRMWNAWRDGSEVWRVLRAYLPGSIETHRLVQVFLFDEDLRLRRHDDSVNVAGGFEAAQRRPDRRPMLEMLMVSVDISEARFT